MTCYLEDDIIPLLSKRVFRFGALFDFFFRSQPSPAFNLLQPVSVLAPFARDESLRRLAFTAFFLLMTFFHGSTLHINWRYKFLSAP